MEKQFYRSRNIPIDHPMIVTAPDPPASTHQLSRLPNMQKLISKQISNLYESKSKQIHYQQKVDTTIKQSQQILSRLQRSQLQIKRTQRKHEQITKQKDTKILVLFFQIQRLTKINHQIIQQMNELRFQNNSLQTHYNNQLKKFRFELQNRSQNQLRVLKQQFTNCIEDMKFKYSQRLGLLRGKDREEQVKLGQYKQLITIMQKQNEFIIKQKQSIQKDLDEIKQQMKQKVKIIQSQLNKKREQNLQLIIKNNELELSSKLFEQKYRKVLKLNEYFQEKVVEGVDRRSVLDKQVVKKAYNKSFEHSQNSNISYRVQESELESQIQSKYNNKIPIVQYDKYDQQHQNDKYSNTDKSIKKNTPNIKKTPFKGLQQSHNNYHLEQQLQSKTLQIQQLNNQINHLNKILKQKQIKYKQQIKSSEQSIIQLNLVISQLQQKNHKLSILLDQIKRASQQAIDDKQSQITNYKMRTQECQNEIVELKIVQQNLLNELEEYKSKDKEYMEILDMKSSRQLSGEFDQIRKQNLELNNQVDSLRRQLEEKQLQISRLNEIFQKQQQQQQQQQEHQQQESSKQLSHNSHLQVKSQSNSSSKSKTESKSDQKESPFDQFNQQLSQFPEQSQFKQQDQDNNKNDCL